ncbi:MAG: trehalase family glycosidase [Actinomycetota bacterium]|nr:trehalase family glycosidase [Actinomycetota bacterium]
MAPVTSLGGREGLVTLVDESTFCISHSSGDMVPGRAHGLFMQDMRIISRWELRVNGSPTESLAEVGEDPTSSVFVLRARPSSGRADSTLLVRRERYIGRGMREDIRIKNFATEAAFCSVELFVDADFADVFAVKEGRATDPDGEVARDSAEDRISFSYRRGGVQRGVELSFGGPVTVSGDLATFEVVVPPGEEWATCIQVTPVVDGARVVPRYVCGQPVRHAAPAERLARWRRQVPVVDSDNEGLREVVARGADDLGALRLFDPDFPDRVVVAAGAPWFMTLFGRDSILTAWMSLIVDPGLALGVLQTLARLQGKEVNPINEEQPGRILHEVRFGESATLSLGGGSIYYGTADATPLFVMLLGELRRWGLAREAVDHLLPYADRALTWIEEFGDADGDGYVEYQRATDRGLVHQGWKDSWDGIRYADGRVAAAPIALAEVQAYTYAAYIARSHFAHEAGDWSTRERFAQRAAKLKSDFNRDFWLADRGWYAVGLDADKKPIDSLTSNIGHCLWTGIIDENRASAVAERLLSPEMFSGWGVRTLATSMGGYNPISYHCGSVWPHDSAIVAAGLSRYGFMEGAQRIAMGIVDAGMSLGGRLPELFSGLAREEFAIPVSYPTSCSPQAWSAASSLQILRTLLRLDPWVPYGKTWLAPALPEGIERLRIEGVPLAGARLDIEVSGGKTTVEGLPQGIELVSEPRRPLTAL